jgi:hypothetical protein
MRLCVCLLLLAPACAPGTRLRRALAPERYVTPAPDDEDNAALHVSTGWRGDPYVPFAPPVAFTIEDEAWIRPVEVTNKGSILLQPTEPGLTLRVYRRHIGVGQRDFHEIVSRSGTLGYRLETAIRPMPTHALDTTPVEISMRDLTNVYSDDRVKDGDLVLFELSDPARTEIDHFLFRNIRYGWRTRVGAGLLFRVPVPIVEIPQDVDHSPALAASVSFGYRFRHPGPVMRFVQETFMLVASAGVSQASVQQDDVTVPDVVRSTIVGAGIEMYQIVSLQLSATASGFIEDDPTLWALAVGIDAVQLTQWADQLLARLWKEHPIREDMDHRRIRPVETADVQVDP